MIWTVKTEKNGTGSAQRSTKPANNAVPGTKQTGTQTGALNSRTNDVGGALAMEYLRQAQTAAKPSAATAKQPAAATAGKAGGGSDAYNQYLITQVNRTQPQRSYSPVVHADSDSTAPEAKPTTAPAKDDSYDLSGYIQQQQAAALAAKLAGLEGAYRQSLADYDAAAEALPRSYDAARNATAAQAALARQAFDERAAAAGLSSGAAAQAELARDSIYRGALADIDLEQTRARQELTLAKATLQNQYETAIAQARATGEASMASALHQELLRVQAQEKEDARYAQKLALNYAMLPGMRLDWLGSINSLADLAGLVYKSGKSSAR